MDKQLKDERFAKVGTDRKFRFLGKKERKVKIDNRFQSVFKDERFVARCDVDPRGRPKSFGSKEKYTKFYDLKGSDKSESESSDSEDENKDDNKDDVSESDDDDASESDDANDENKDDIDADLTSSEEKEEVQTDDGDDSDSDEDDLEPVMGQKISAKVKKDEKVAAEDAGSDAEEEVIEPVKIDPSITAKLQTLEVDYARGEANLYSDSSSGESSEEEDDQEETDYLESINKWGELDQDAEHTEEITSRLAVCNMDWDKVNADDIFLALSSFCPAGGCVKSVNVYVSEFGKSRLEEEDRMGPAELRRLAEENSKAEEAYKQIVDTGKNAKKEEEMAMQRVREHQLNRLRYYYAVTEFDSEDTANSVYTECDGQEFESSATVFDLRFIPDDTTFDDQPASSCTSIPEKSKYRPKYLNTSVLTGKKAKLSWDEQDAEREHKMKKAYQEIDNDGEDLSFAKGLVASSSEEEEEQEKEKKAKNKKLKKKNAKAKKVVAEDSDENVELGSDDSNNSDDGSENEEDIEKYRALIFGLDKDKKSVAEPGDMEITWQQDDDDEEQPEVQSEQDDEELTPFEKMLKKKKDRNDRKRQERKMRNKGSEAEESDDDIPDDVDLNDPFFAEENGESKAAKHKKKKKRSKKRKHEEDESGNDEGKDDLALLVLDDEDDSKHFNYKTIVEEETMSKSKKKKMKKQKKEEVKDDFDLNVNDDRFAAIYSRPEFNIDPSATSFKKTKAMETLIDEKQKRVTSGQNNKKEAKKKPVEKESKNSNLDPEITASLKAVKNKWAKNAKKKKI